MQPRYLFNIVMIVVSSSVNGQAFVYQKKLSPTSCDSAAMQIPGEFKKTDDYTFNYWNNAFAPAMTKRTDAMVAVLKEAFPGTKGFVGRYYRQMFDKGFTTNGSKAYILTVPIYPFGGPCVIDAKTHKPETKNFTPEGETDTWMYFTVNAPGTFFDNQEKMFIQGEEHTIYFTHPYIGKWKGEDMFGSPEFFNGETWSTTANVWLMFTRKDDKAFTHISRRQYLRALLDTYAEKYQRDAAGMQEKKNIMDYLQNQPDDSLKLPILLYTHRDTDDCKTWFDPANHKTPPVMLFATRHPYWRSNEEDAAPQMIALRFRYAMGSWKDVQIKKSFEQHFPVEKLEALLDK